MKIDEVDIKILSILEKNGRTPNNEIAKRLSLSEGTVRNRIKKMTDSGFLSVKGLTNINLRQDKQLIYVLVKLTPHKEWERSAKRISELPNVKSASMLTGRFDILLEVLIEPPEIVHFIGETLSKIETIISTESLIAVKSFNKWI